MIGEAQQGGQPGLLLPEAAGSHGLVGPLLPMAPSKPAPCALGCKESTVSPGTPLLAVGVGPEKQKGAPVE